MSQARRKNVVDGAIRQRLDVAQSDREVAARNDSGSSVASLAFIPLPLPHD
jgi:hypothetical protein